MMAVAKAWIAALGNSDFEALVRLFSADALIEDPVGTAPKRGEHEIRAYYAILTATKLETALEGEVRVTADACAFAYSVRSLREGRYVRVRPIAICEFDAEGRITRMRTYFGAENTHS